MDDILSYNVKAVVLGVDLATLDDGIFQKCYGVTRQEVERRVGELEMMIAAAESGIIVSADRIMAEYQWLEAVAAKVEIVTND